MVAISNNKAKHEGGAVCIDYNSAVIFQQNASLTFNDNNAGSNGGAVHYPPLL